MKQKKQIILTILLLSQISIANSQETIKLWESTIPNSIIDNSYIEATKGDGIKDAMRTEKVSEPTLTIFQPQDTLSGHPAIIICPGGGYSRLSMSREGFDVARRLTENGIVAIVLKYRLPSDKIMVDRSFGPLADAQKAIRTTRNNAKKWRISPNKIGIMGFSAGGHLAASASVLFETKAYKAEKDAPSARPDFSVLIYPVVSMDTTITHMGTRINLIRGKENEEELSNLFSCENQITENTPQAFIIHAADDRAVNFRNSIRYIDALQKNGVKAEFHVFPNGGHGFGLAEGKHQGEWFDLLIKWINNNIWKN